MAKGRRRESGQGSPRANCGIHPLRASLSGPTRDVRTRIARVLEILSEPHHLSLEAVVVRRPGAVDRDAVTGTEIPDVRGTSCVHLTDVDLHRLSGRVIAEDEVI